MFNKIDTENWPRAQIFYYFSKMAPTGYSLTVDVDVTNLLRTTKEKQLKFFPTYLWLVTKNLNKQLEFKCAVKENSLGFYDFLTPLYATWHEDTHTFSLIWTEYSEKFVDFYENYIENQQKYGSNKGILARPDLPPENAYTVSAVPWVEFKHFAVHSYENKPYYFPSVEAGKFYSKDGKTMMPLSITCHHATTDGYHISEFLKDLQNDMDNFGKFIE